MRMDSSQSHWNNYVLPENILDTTKMFFGTYLYRAELHVPGAFQLRYIKAKTRDQYVKVTQTKKKVIIRERKDTPMTFSRLYDTEHQAIVDCDPQQIYSLHEVYGAIKDQTSMRIGYRNVILYAKTQDDLCFILDHSPTIKNSVKTIHRPRSAAAAMQLSAEVILVKNKSYNYKVVLREGIVNQSIKEYLSNFLDNYEDKQVRAQTTLRKRLKDPNQNYIYGVIYIDDAELVTFLQLIASGNIKKIFKLEQMAE